MDETKPEMNWIEAQELLGRWNDMTEAIVGLFERNHSDKLDEIVELVNHINESTNELLR